MVRDIVQSESSMIQIKVVALDDTWTTGPFKVRMEAEEIVQ